MKSLGLVTALFAACLFSACEEPKKSADAPAQEPSQPAQVEDASGPPEGEPPSPNQPQPVYPDGKPDGA